MKRIFLAIAGSSFFVLPSLRADSEVESILLRDPIECEADCFELTCKFSTDGEKKYNEDMNVESQSTDQQTTYVDCSAGAKSNMGISLANGFSADAELHGEALFGYKKSKTKTDTTEKTVRLSTEQVFKYGDWKLMFKVYLRSTDPSVSFKWSGDPVRIRLKGMGIDRSIDLCDRSTPIAPVRYNAPLDIDFAKTLDDSTLFTKLAVNQYSLETLQVELPADFPLVNEQTGKPIGETMLLGKARELVAPVKVSLMVGAASILSPWNVRPQVMIDGTKQPVTFRMALEAIHADIVQHDEMPDEGFQFDLKGSLESVCGIPLGTIATIRDDEGKDARVVLLVRIDSEYHSSLPSEHLDQPLNRDGRIAFVGVCVDAIANVPVDNLSKWSDSERKALLEVLDKAAKETPGDVGVNKAAACLRLADPDANERLQGAMALDRFAEVQDKGSFTILYQLYSAKRLDGVSEERVERWRRCAAELGDAQAQFEVGRACTKQRRFPEAFAWTNKAAEQDHAEAQRVLADFYLNGRGVARDEEKAVKWYMKATEHFPGIHYTGFFVFFSVDPRFSHASTEQAPLESLAALGRLYVKGCGVSKDVDKGLQMIKISANRGNPFGQAQLGLRFKYNEAKSETIGFLDGSDTRNRKNAKEALKWFRASAAQTNSYGLARLGVCYRDGYGVASNSVEAVRLFRMAIEHDTEYWGEYQRLLGKCYLDGNGVERNDKEAARLFREAAEMGDSDGQLELGWCYLLGIGVDKNASEARKWVKEAKRNGNQHAKGVRLTNSSIIISRFGKTIEIPFSELNEQRIANPLISWP